MTTDDVLVILAGLGIAALVIWPHLWGLLVILAGVLVALDRRPHDHS